MKYVVLIALTLASFAQSKPTAKVNAGVSPSVTLSGCVDPGILTFNFYRGLVKGGPYTKLGTAATCNYVDTTVAFSTTYYYVATAVATTGESGYSNEAQAVIGANPIPPPPTGLTATPAIAGNIPLQWNAPINAQIKGYRLYRKVPVRVAWDTVAVAIRATNYMDAPPKPGIYQYEVRAVAVVGSKQLLSDPSNVAEISYP